MPSMTPRIIVDPLGITQQVEANRIGTVNWFIAFLKSQGFRPVLPTIGFEPMTLAV